MSDQTLTDLVERARQAETRIRHAQAFGRVATARAWRCDRPDCDGEPHGRWHHCEHPEGFSPLHFPSCRHARGPQVPRAAFFHPGTLIRVSFRPGGRGSGKTWGAGNTFKELILTSEPGEWAVIAPTFGDARDVCIESQESGLIHALGGRCGGDGMLVDRGEFIASWNRSVGHLRLNDGSIVYCDGGNDGAYRIQGKNLRGAWVDEVGLIVKWKPTWDESLRYAVRLAPAKIVVTGTPKHSMPARELIKRLVGGDAYEEGDGMVDYARLRTADNLVNLDSAAAASFMASKGTALGRQETEGELIDNVEGALWHIDLIDQLRIERPDPSDGDPFAVEAIYALIQPVRVCIAVDPAVSYSEESDEHGIVVVAKGSSGHHYILEDLSGRMPVTRWPVIVMEAMERWQADRVVAEVNNGGDYVEATMRAQGYRGGYETVRATRGKQLRAEPLAQFYQLGQAHHVGVLGELETQMTQWVPGETDKSPDRLDALVWGCTWLEPRLAGGWEQLYLPRDPDVEEPPPKRNSWARVYAPAEDDGRPKPPVPAQTGPGAMPWGGNRRGGWLG